MADQQKAHVYTSRELLIKSNPSLFENIPDVTNPREIYNFLSKTHARSIDDLTAIRHHAEEVAVSFPRLSRTTSLKDLRKAAGILPESRREKHFSSHDISRVHQKDPSITALFINAPYLNIDDLRYLPGNESNQTVKRSKTLTLPYLKKDKTQETSFQRKRHNTPRSADKNEDLSLPYIHSERKDTLIHGEDQDTVHRKHKKQNDEDSSSHLDTKLDKWFSEMPGEVVDKANKAVMEDYAKENVQPGDEKDSRKRSSALDHHSLPLLKPIKTMPEEYSELRLRNSHKDYLPSVLNRDQYKLRQKSLLKLKTSGSEENGTMEKHKTSPCGKYEPPSYSYSTERIFPLEKKPSLRDLVKSKKQSGNGVNTVHIDEFAMEAYEINPSDRFTFARPQNDECSHLQQNLLKRSKTMMDVNTRNSHRSALTTSNSEGRVGILPRGEKLQRALTIIKVDKPTLEELRNRYSKRKRSDPGSTKRDSSADTSESRRKDGRPPTRVSNGSAPKEKKTVLKFKRLEVFSSNGTSISGYDDQCNGHDERLPDKPYVKLDLRRAGNQVCMDRGETLDQPSFLLNRNSKGDPLPSLTFQFNTGEVIVTRNLSALEQDCLGKEKRGFYPRREPIKSSQHQSPVAMSRSRNSSPSKDLREAIIQKSFQDNETESTYTMTPNYKNVGDRTPILKSRGPHTPKSCAEMWSNSNEMSVWPQKPEKIEETEEEEESPSPEESPLATRTDPAMNTAPSLDHEDKLGGKDHTINTVPSPTREDNFGQTEHTLETGPSPLRDENAGQTDQTNNTASSSVRDETLEEMERKRDMATSMTSFVEKNDGNSN